MSIFRVFNENYVHICLHANVSFIRFPKRVWKTFFACTEWIWSSKLVEFENNTRWPGRFVRTVFFLCVWFERKTKPKLLITIGCTWVTRLSFILLIFPYLRAAKFIAHETEVTYDDVFRNEKAIDTDGGGRSGCAFYTVLPYGFCRETRPNMPDNDGINTIDRQHV